METLAETVQVNRQAAKNIVAYFYFEDMEDFDPDAPGNETHIYQSVIAIRDALFGEGLTNEQYEELACDDCHPGISTREEYDAILSELHANA